MLTPERRAELRGLAESAQPFIRHGGTDPAAVYVPSAELAALLDAADERDRLSAVVERVQALAPVDVSDWDEDDFETQRDHDRRELTERFANQRQTRTGAINELSALLDAEDERVRLTAEAIETARTEDFVISGRIRID